MEITLTRAEEFTAHKAAIALAESNNDYWDTRRGVYEAAVSGLDLHEFLAQDAQSIGSEWAVAKALGFNFDPYLAKGKRIADVGRHIEVKWTKYPYGHLIIQEIDRVDDIAVLVLGKSPNYIVRGCMPIAWARHKNYRHKEQANWWIPQGDLLPIADIPLPDITVAS